MLIKKISLKKAVEIIEKRKPLGKFIMSKRGWSVGIINQEKGLDINEFNNINDCKKWLT